VTTAPDPADVDGPPSGGPVGRIRLTPDQTAALTDLDHPTGGSEPPDPRSPRTMTDDANALRLVDAHGSTIRRVGDMSAWWHWTGTVWQRDHESAHLREHARALARALPEDGAKAKSFKRNSLSSAGISGCVRVAESDPRIAVRAADLDAHPLLLNTPSGVVDLRTGTITRPDPGLLLTRVTAVGVDPDAGPYGHPRWTAFLAETFADDTELIGYVQRLAGLALIGEVREHVLPFLYGVGANGKSVLLLVLQGLLGPADTGGYAVSAPDGFLMAGRDTAHPTEIARLRGARLLVCSEQSSGRRFDEAKVKRLTGGDVLTGRFMRGDFFDFTPSHLTVIASNHLPQVREGGPSFWRRVRLIPFTNVVPEHRRDPDLAARILDAEGPAVLGWAVRGAIAVLAGGLADPPRVKAATEDYRISEDSLASFVRDDCLLGAGHWCDVGSLRARYEQHAAQMGVEPLSARGLTLRLVAEYGVEQGRLSRPARRIYRGIGLLTDDLSDSPDDEPDDRPQAREPPNRPQPADPCPPPPRSPNGG
jgi:putative DNA primase/helicase